eukprot:5828842-Prymnesium_polylepis.1
MTSEQGLLCGYVKSLFRSEKTPARGPRRFTDQDDLRPGIRCGCSKRSDYAGLRPRDLSTLHIMLRSVQNNARLQTLTRTLVFVAIHSCALYSHH